MSDQHSHHRTVSKRKPRRARRPVSGNYPAARDRGLKEALVDALEQLEAARLQTTRRTNQSDDDEDPTRRG